MLVVVKPVSQLWNWYLQTKHIVCTYIKMFIKVLLPVIYGVLRLVWKNKIQLSKFQDLIGFTKGFMNQEASHLATRRELLGIVQNRRFI